MAEDVKEIIEQGNFQRCTVVSPPISIEPILDYSVAFPSADSILDWIMQTLQDNEKKIIGVHGMGGVGKTTLMKRLNNKLGKIRLFDKVIMVSVSQNSDVRIIQDGIAKRLDFALADVDLSIRARKLSEKLKEVKELLIILDDVWSRFELSEVGIPCTSEHEGCRIILTTRNEDICRQMGTHWNIELKVLSKAESWALLKSRAGDVVDFDKIKPIAEKILKSCKGLPLAIVTIGSTLKMEGDERIWKHALRALTNESAIGPEGVIPEVIQSIRYCYVRLESDEIKHFFLLCCLFPEDWEIDPSTLLAYGIGEGCFRECSNYEEARDKSYVLINKLKASSLLLECNNSKRVVMHDIVRDAAIYIASKEHDFFVRSGHKLDKWPGLEELGKCSRISLMNNEITTLPNEPKCPKLLSLILQGNEWLRKMPNLFFENMRGLVVLDLGRTGIQRLPSSISYLKCLRVLLLCRCWELKEISPIEGLEKLETLDLAGTSIRELQGIKGLTNVKFLDLSETKALNVSSNLISRLSCLEELYMSGSFSEWEIGNEGDGSKAHFSEVASLPYLAILHVDVQDLNSRYQDYFASLKNLTSLCIRAGRLPLVHPLTQSPLHRSRTIDVHDGSVPCNSDWVKILLQKTRVLGISIVEGLKNKFQLGAKDINSVTSLSVNEDCEVEHLINVKKEPTHIAFPRLTSVVSQKNKRLTSVSLFDLQLLSREWEGVVQVGSLNCLEKLSICNCHDKKYLVSTPLIQALENLKDLQICYCNGMKKIISDEDERVEAGDGVLPRELPQHLALHNLRDLFIHGCKNLEYLFPYRLVKNLVHLDSIEVFGCFEMEEIIFIDNEEAPPDENVLPMLKRLFLCFLPKLRTICKGRPTFHWLSLETIWVAGCPQLKRLPMGSQSAPGLGSFKVDKEWLEGLEWEDHQTIIKSRLSACASFSW